MNNVLPTIKNAFSKLSQAIKKAGQTIQSRLPKTEKGKNTLMLVIIVSLVLICFFLLRGGVGTAASAMRDSYRTTYAAEKESAYNALYQSAYERAEKNYHVSSAVVISIGELEETQKLEVLKANNVAFITEDRDNNSGNVTAWLEVEGEGTFVVNLQAAEFLVDNDRHYVLVRIPNPELTNIVILKTTRRLFADDWKDGSYREGVDLALKQRNEATLQMQKSLLSNQYIFGNAQKAAVRIIENLVRQFNPDIPDLIVDVEFMS